MIGWLEPDGPPKAWWLGLAEQIRDASDGAALVSLLDAAAGLLPDVDAALDHRDAPQASTGLDALADWFELGDGVVPFDAQTPAGSTWVKGTPLATAHPDLPADPAAISQIRVGDRRLGGRARLQCAARRDPPRPGVRRLQCLDPLPAGCRAGPVGERPLRPPEPRDRSADGAPRFRDGGRDPYTADLLDGDLAHLAVQLGRVVDRVKALTGRAQVFLVGHSTAGLAAWLYGAAQPDSVAGVVTLGTPFGGSALAPLFHGDVAGAVRLLDTLLPASARTPEGRAIAHLARTMDGLELYLPAHFGGIVGVVDTVQGFAIQSRLPASLIKEVAATVAERLAVAASGVAPPTHFAYGARARFAIHADAGAMKAETTVRVDARQVNLADRSAPRLGPYPRWRCSRR